MKFLPRFKSSKLCQCRHLHARACQPVFFLEYSDVWGNISSERQKGEGAGGGGCLTYTSSWRLSGGKVNMSIGPYGRTSIYRNARDIQAKEQL